MEATVGYVIVEEGASLEGAALVGVYSHVRYTGGFCSPLKTCWRAPLLFVQAKDALAALPDAARDMDVPQKDLRVLKVGLVQVATLTREQMAEEAP